MDIKKLYEKYIYRLACCFFITTAAAVTVNAYSGYVLDNLLTVFFALLFSAAAVLFDIMAKKPVLYITLGAAAAAFFVFIFIFELPLVETLNSSFVWLLYESKDKAVVDAVFEYALISIAVSELIASVIVFVLMKYKYFRLAAGIAVAVTMLVLAFFEYDADKMTVFFVFAYIFSVSLEYVLKKTDYRHGVSYLLPFILTAGIITAALPSSETPIQWNAVRGILRNVQSLAYKIGDTFALIFDSDQFDFGLNMTGFSEEGAILGGLENSDREALFIKRNVNSGKNLYLTGTVMGKYSGKGWERDDSGGYENGGLCEYELDMLETLLALYGGGLLGDGEVYAARDIEVFYSGLRTRSMFYPLKTLNINSYLKPDMTGANMFLNGISDEKTSYRLRYLDIDYSDDRIIEIFKSKVPVTESVSESFLREINKKTGTVSISEIPSDYKTLFENRKKSIKESYTRLPESVRSEVYSLSAEITAEYANDYDKLRALEYFLSGFRYTLTPPALTEDEITYQLLFETGEGYCTYFATAFAVMARTIGIPTRFVQGYLTSFDEKTDSNLYVIRNKNAHAWAEAYIDGVGWVPFEPTPGFTSARYPEWERKKPSAGGGTEISYEYNESIVAGEEAPQELSEEKSEGAVVSFLIIAGVITAAVVAAVTFTFVINSYRRKRKLNVNDAGVYYLDNFRYLMLFMKILGFEPESGETFSSFAVRLDNHKLSEISPVHQKLRYGGETPSSAEIESLVSYREELAETVRKKIGRLRYYILVYK